jgi:hypothetical protein
VPAARPAAQTTSSDNHFDTEDAMIDTAFERPLVLFVGLGFPHQLNDAGEAFQLLSELPPRDHGAAHAAALAACRAAMQGSVDPETARGIVAAYARARGMLANETLAPAAMEAKHDLLGA